MSNNLAIPDNWEVFDFDSLALALVSVGIIPEMTVEVERATFLANPLEPRYYPEFRIRIIGQRSQGGVSLRGESQGWGDTPIKALQMAVKQALQGNLTDLRFDVDYGRDW